MAAETPCSVLYNDIRSFGGLKHLEIARMLINGNSYAGSTLLDKCSTNRSYLTRYIVHREPDQCAPGIYNDLTVSTLNLAAAIGCAVEQVSVKATTEEGLGFTGSKQGIAAHCVCLLERI